MTAMAALAERKCLNHNGREAVARCPGCRSYFCRECVSEHAGRILCAPCLTAEMNASNARRKFQTWVPMVALFGIGFAWMLFMGLGKILLAIPAEVHDGGWADPDSDAARIPKAGDE